MFSAALRVLRIKDLKDLSVFFGRGYYRHAGPNRPEEMFSRERSRGPVPRATVKKSVLFTVGRGPVPRRASVEGMAFVCVRFSCRSGDRGGQAPALRARKDSPRYAPFGSRRSRTTVSGARGRSRGTGPRATDNRANRANRGNRDNLENPAPAWLDEGQALALRGRETASPTVARGPSPAIRAGERVSPASTRPADICSSGAPAPERIKRRHACPREEAYRCSSTANRRKFPVTF